MTVMTHIASPSSIQTQIQYIVSDGEVVLINLNDIIAKQPEKPAKKLVERAKGEYWRGWKNRYHGQFGIIKPQNVSELIQTTQAYSEETEKNKTGSKIRFLFNGIVLGIRGIHTEEMDKKEWLNSSHSAQIVRGFLNDVITSPQTSTTQRPFPVLLDHVKLHKTDTKNLYRVSRSLCNETARMIEENRYVPQLTRVREFVKITGDTDEIIPLIEDNLSSHFVSLACPHSDKGQLQSVLRGESNEAHLTYTITKQQQITLAV